MATREEIVDRHMARVIRIGAENTFIAVPGESLPIPLRQALIDYVDDLIDSFEDVRFHFNEGPVTDLDLSENEKIYISVNPYEMKWLSKTKFISDDLNTRKTVNMRAALRNPKASKRMEELFTIIVRTINELDRFEEGEDE